MAFIINLPLLLTVHSVFCQPTSNVQLSDVWETCSMVRDKIGDVIALLQDTRYCQSTNPDPLSERMGMVINSPSLGYSYLLMMDQKTWENARQDCINKGYHLAWIESMQEQDYIVNIIKANPDFSNLNGGPWIGGTDQGHDGCWVWSAPKIRPITGRFTHWREGEPNNYAETAENCLHMYRSSNYKWNDFPCSSLLRYICKRDTGTFVTFGVTIQMIENTPVCDRK